jgi:hypothetical protein
MKFGVNVLLLIVALLIAASALGKPGKNGKKRRRNTTEKSRPAIVVAVVDLKVDSEKNNVKGKIQELSTKLREAVEKNATSFEVVSSRKMRMVRRRHRRAISNCYDDCDVEFGILANANFVIGGHLEPSASGIVGTLEIRNTQSREIVSSKTISGANYFEFESALLASVRRFVRPLNHVVFQATDDEVVRDGPPEPAKTEEDDVTGLGSSSDAAVAPGASAPESDYIATPPEVERREPSILDPYWDEAKEEPPFMKEQDLGFDKDNGPGMFAVGVNGGYSINLSGAKHMRKLFTPVFHIGAEVMARLHHLFEIAIVADIDYLTGDEWADTRFGTSRMRDADPDKQLNSEEVKNIKRYNEYKTGNYLTVGIRPTARLIIPLNMMEFFVGAGIGANYVKTSGYWLTSATATQILIQDTGVPEQEIRESVPYNFKKSSLGFYAVFEVAVIVRAFSDRLGVGALFQFKIPSMWSSGAKSDVTIDEQSEDYYVQRNVFLEGDVSAFGEPSPDDVINSPIGHMDSLNLMTIGLIADWRF